MYSQNLEELSLNVKRDLLNTSKKVNKQRLKAIAKTVITTVILIGGITSAIVIPNPISAGIAIAAATVLSGSEGIRHSLKALKKTKKNTKLIKETDKQTDEMV